MQKHEASVSSAAAQWYQKHEGPVCQQQPSGNRSMRAQSASCSSVFTEFKWLNLQQQPAPVLYHVNMDYSAFPPTAHYNSLCPEPASTVTLSHRLHLLQLRTSIPHCNFALSRSIISAAFHATQPLWAEGAHNTPPTFLLLQRVTPLPLHTSPASHAAHCF
eukprot:scaffold74162_cov19-Tisochrysis_lutea.AAC.1